MFTSQDRRGLVKWPAVRQNLEKWCRPCPPARLLAELGTLDPSGLCLMWASLSKKVADIRSSRAIREAETCARLPWNHPLGPCHPCWEDPGEGQMSKWVLVGAHTPFPPVDPLTWFLLTQKFQSEIIFGSFSTNLFFYNLQIGSFDPT